ncbi:hypothetical protein RclHR1_17120001 [Rhizophagus clarus]|uniref:Uncharacterized protein n=1 Tax=Rhizophagus clarus TaxID=94130 RepID=A0A2Z6QNE4_9GLOM|nr:hypothetical protein RclHR1_17120001 [Rhizophagus clarus]GES79788.1 hypothetical protein GLOIN_2v1496007 [Rhizophagus clarus]
MVRFTLILGFLIIIFPYAYFSFPFSPTPTVPIIKERQVTGCNLPHATFTTLPYSNPDAITTNDGNVHSQPCEGSPVTCYLNDNVKYTITQYVTDGECVNGTSSIWFYVIAQCEGYIWGGATSYEIQKCYI